MIIGSAPAAPEVRCTITDPRLDELSGMVVVPDGVWVVADGGRTTEVHRLDESCIVVETRAAPIDPYDVEDLAVGPDGALWAADIGDNRRGRETIAVMVLPPAGEPRLHRLRYPDGPRDAEALIVDASGVPFVVTKEAGAARVYRTAAAPAGIGPSALEHVGDVVLPASDSPGGPLGALGSRVVTGAAVGPGVLALRTYTDAWLYPWDGGDVMTALRVDPVQVPLPGEPQGEAVAFEPDGTLLSASEARDGRAGELRAVPGAAGLVAVGEPVSPPARAPGPARPEWFPAAVAAGGAAGLLALGAAVLGVRARRR